MYNSIDAIQVLKFWEKWNLSDEVYFSEVYRDYLYSSTMSDISEVIEVIAVLLYFKR